MNDRLPGKPGRYSGVIDPADVQKLQKAEPFAITLTRDDEPIREGTPYSKATVLPDDVAKMLCPEKEDPTPADAFRHLGEGNLGANKDAFALLPFVVYQNAYHGVDGEPVSKAGCSVYRLYLGDENERLFGKTIQIKTYAYGDMAYGFEGEPGTRINPGAYIVRDPQSGVCEFAVTLPEYDPTNANFFFHVSFCENSYTNFEMYEKKGTVWEEIKKLQSLEGHVAVESAATAIRYTQQVLSEEQKAQARANIGVAELAQSIGISATAAMSQRAVTEELYGLEVIEFVSGSISSDNGAALPNTQRCRSGYISVCGDEICYSANPEYQIYGHFYDADNIYIGKTGWQTSFTIAEYIKEKPSVTQLRVVIRRKDENKITVAETAGICWLFSNKFDRKYVKKESFGALAERVAVLEANMQRTYGSSVTVE